ncbi:unnamed protein product [Caenorhabditis auriculariae]|uniref:Acetyl-coenzyme A transporter 1 n=1 Tax=Caenorhabditis auriculariae TaxID=2777116 RepID=A0A8S1HGU9_9PELO|nr:unnamed protein product [Caenorhabditis auriculariae]
MSERMRARHRRQPRNAEDVMAVEPSADFSAAGPLMPNLFHPPEDVSDNDSVDSDDDDHHRKLIRDPTVDPNANWFKKNTRCTSRRHFLNTFAPIFVFIAGRSSRFNRSDSIASFRKACHLRATGRLFIRLLAFQFEIVMGADRRLGLLEKVGPKEVVDGAVSVLDRHLHAGPLLPRSQPNVIFLMLIFLPLNFLAATQDIAVDGWALTMLSKRNVGYASTCNAVGQTAGYFLGNVVFLALESADFCNTFLRTTANQKETGIVDLASYVFFWGWVFIGTTTLVLIFKREVDKSVAKSTPPTTPSQPQETDDEEELELGIFETYTVLWKILCLKPMIYMLIILITGKMAFAATDGMTSLKLIGMGIPKDRLASIGLFLTPMQILLPWMIGKWTAGPRPLNIFLLAYPYRIFVGGIFAALVWWTPHFRLPDGKFEYSVYIVWIGGYIFHQVATYCMFVSMMAFCAQISDPRIGGTYMTLLNTINNLGGNWPVTLILSLTDWFTFKDCVKKGTKSVLYACNKKDLADQCAAGGDVCEVSIDGYFIAVAFCSVVGIIWYKLLFNKVKYLQKIPRSQWSVIKK